MRKRAVKTRLQVVHLPNVVFYHRVICTVSKKIFVPKCNKPDKENVEIQEKDCREELIRGSILCCLCPQAMEARKPLDCRAWGEK